MDDKKNKKFVWFLFLLSFIGLAYMAAFGKAELIPVYIFLTFVTIPFNYFNYGLCKHRNYRYNIWNKKNTEDTEPSGFALGVGKFFCWLAYFIGLILVFV